MFTCFFFLFLGSPLHFSTLLHLFKIGKKTDLFISLSLSVPLSLSLSLSVSLFLSFSLSIPIHQILSLSLCFSLFLYIYFSLSQPLCLFLPPPPPTHTHIDTSCNLTCDVNPVSNRCTIILIAQISGSPAATQTQTLNFVMHTTPNGVFFLVCPNKTPSTCYLYFTSVRCVSDRAVCM